MITPDSQTEVIEAGAIEAMTRGEIDVAIATARKFRRSPAVVKSEMMTYATLDEETAAACFYSLPRGGKLIQGPSVRLAEIAVSAFGNMRVGYRVMQTVTTGDHPHVVVQAVCFDLEKNVTVSTEKRRRITKKKSKDAIDDDDINLAVNSCAAIAYRDAVFKVVPLALVKPVYEQCRKVAVGDAKSLVERRGKCLEAFSKMGVTPERILARIEKTKIEEITLDDIEILLGLHTALKDGEEAIEDVFPLIPKHAAKSTAPTPPVQPATNAPTKPENRPSEPPAPAAAPSTPSQAETRPEAQQQAGQANPEATPQQAAASDTANSAAQEAGVASQPAVEPPPSAETPLQTVTRVIGDLGISERQIMRYLQGLKPPMARGSQNNLGLLADVKLANIAKMLGSENIVEEIRAINA